MAKGRRTPEGGSPPRRAPLRARGVRTADNAPRAVPARLAAAPLGDLAFRLLHHANSGLPRIDYLAEVLNEVLEASGADRVSLWLREGARLVRCGRTRGRPASFRYETVRGGATPGARLADVVALAVLAKGTDATLPPLLHEASSPGDCATGSLPPAPTVGSRTLLPIAVGGERVGVLELRSRRRDAFTPEAVAAYERLAPVLGCALVSQQAQAAVHERVKELTCLYGITQIAGRPELTVAQIVEGVVRVLPAAWQYPEITVARIVLDGRAYASPGFHVGGASQTTAIVANRVERGFVEVAYARHKPKIDEGPFLKEERSLIDAIARQLALIIERRDAAAERAKLEEQLRHADRLATIGQLATGVAHELNEPLGNVLGFAQLATKAINAGEPVAADLQKITKAALHAREIVKKLMLFARQAPRRKTAVNLNTVVLESLYFVEARCAKQGIELVRRLKPSLPDIVADPSQLQQVLVNLVVNAVQAMPSGGRLTIRTGRADGHVSLVVEDTGLGMSDEVRQQIFIPFFTTKDVDEGTGLGLSVVHGIVSAHGGSIAVKSEPGRGSRFEILLPVAGVATFKEVEPDAVFW